ncbi:MAG: hypothetical protein A2W27_01350 [Deltaproteobacteria bacterium RBG_16_44_11]|nr:MAG: hypothetical protein A2W27_01350 [Deltaproteobacteria bacterium RBG_16_44_11]
MKHLFAKCILCIIMISITGIACATECDNPKSSEEVAYCLGKELRNSDVKINQTYQTLISKLAKDEQEKLRQDQRAWIKERDSVCNCTSKESNREKWYQWLLKDYRKTVCVTRYTRQRTAELDRMLTDLSLKSEVKETPTVPAQPASKKVKNVQGNYAMWSTNNKTSGRWYFEVTINRADIAKFSPTALSIGCTDRKFHTTSGVLYQIRSSDTNAPVFREGFALDLESGKLYLRGNGTWYKGVPGSSGGLDLKLNPHNCGIETTVLIAPLIEKGYLQLNFGEKPFVYSIPDSYRPFVEGGK